MTLLIWADWRVEMCQFGGWKYAGMKWYTIAKTNKLTTLLIVCRLWYSPLLIMCWIETQNTSLHKCTLHMQPQQYCIIGRSHTHTLPHRGIIGTSETVACSFWNDQDRLTKKTRQELRMLSLSLFIQGSLWILRLLFSIVKNVISVTKATSL